MKQLKPKDLNIPYQTVEIYPPIKFVPIAYNELFIYFVRRFDAILTVIQQKIKNENIGKQISLVGK